MDLPSDSSIAWIVRRFAALAARDRDHKRKLVQPTGEFFPDSFDGDAGSMNLLFWRLQEHSGLTELDCELRFVDDRDQGHECKCGDGGCKDGGCGSGSCGSGGCGTGSCGCHSKERSLAPVAKLRDGGYRVDVRLSDAKNATTLTAAMATSLAHVFALETGGLDDWPEAEWVGTCELAACLLGFGVLLGNASYMYAKACKGVSIDRATALEVAEIALGLAMYVALAEQQPARAAANLEPTPREAFDEARLWVDSNGRIMKRMRRDPLGLAADEHLTLEPAQPWLARVLGIGGRKKKQHVDLNDEQAVAQIAADMAAKRAGGKKERDPKLDELRALVDDSLNEVRGTAAD